MNALIRVHSENKVVVFLPAVLTLLVLNMVMLGCGGGTSTTGHPPPTPLTISPSSASVLLGNSQQFTCNVSCGNWGVNGTAGGNATVGTVSSSGLYTAPADLPGSATVTVSASGQTSSQSATASAVIQSDISVAITPSPAGAISVPEGGTLQLAAVITSAGKPDNSVQWAVNAVAGGNTATGTISSQGLYSGPSSLPNPPRVTITATSVADAAKSANALFTIAGTLATISQQISAAVGGAITLPDGSNVVIPGGILNSDQVVTLSEVTILPQQPPNKGIASVGTGLILTLATPNSAARNTIAPHVRPHQSAGSCSGSLQFTITDSLTNNSALQGSAAVTDAQDASSNDYWTAPSSSSFDGNTSQATYSCSELSGISSIDVSQANPVPAPAPTPLPQYGPLTFSGGAWGPYTPPSGTVLVLVHGMASNVNNGAFPATTAGSIQSQGDYTSVVGFNYNWQQDINQSGSDLAGFLNQLAATPGVQQIDIEAHSEGGPVTISAGGQVNSQTVNMLGNIAFLTSPLEGTDAATSALNAETWILNEGTLGAGTLIQSEASPCFSGMTPGNTELSDNISAFNSNLAANTNIRTFSVAADYDLLAGHNPVYGSGTPDDTVIETNSEIGANSGIANLTSLGVFPVSHLEVESNLGVQGAVGAQIAMNVTPVQLTFTVPADGSNPQPQTIQLTNTKKTITWSASVSSTIAPPAPWLTLDQTSGSTPGTITASIDAASITTFPANGAIALTGTYASGNSVTTTIPVTVMAANSSYSGSFTGTITDDDNGPCPGASAAMEGGVTITLTPVGSSIYSISGQVTLNQDVGLCNNYSGTYSVIGGVDASGNVAFAYAAGLPPAVNLGFTGSLASGTISNGMFVLAGGIDSQGYFADTLQSPLSMTQNSTPSLTRNQGVKR